MGGGGFQIRKNANGSERGKKGFAGFIPLKRKESPGERSLHR